MSGVTLVGAIVAAVFALAPAGAAAAGTTYFASPEGDVTECSASEPCDVQTAVETADDGDSIELGAGTYKLPFSGLRLEKEVDFGAGPGAPAVIETTTAATIAVGPKAHATVHDLYYLGTGPLNLESGVAERVFVDYIGPDSSLTDVAACELGLNTTLRDSVCWAREAGESTDANAIQVIASNEGVTGTTYLRNDTAIASDDGGHGVFAFATYGARFDVDVRNVIAQSLHTTDIAAALLGASNPEADVIVSHSNFATFSEELPYSTVTAPTKNSNQTAPPAFVEASAGDFHQATGSPTIDGGVADAQTGTQDLDGNARGKPGCFGAGDTPDIGAFEFTAVAQCPPPPPPPPPEPEPKKPVFRIVNVTVRGAGGSIEVETPSAGTLTLTGLGVRLAARPSPGPGAVVKLPIRPWAITRVRLNRAGKTRVHLVVKFDPAIGIEHQKARSVLLKKG